MNRNPGKDKKSRQEEKKKTEFEKELENFKKRGSILTAQDWVIINKFLSPSGKILHRRKTKLKSKGQKAISKLIKSGRIEAVLPFVAERKFKGKKRRFKRSKNKKKIHLSLMFIGLRSFNIILEIKC